MMRAIKFVIIMVALMATIVNAQTTQPQFLATWQANNYVPSGYLGKTLPTRGSSVNVVFELINGGRPVNLSDYEIRWYVNDKLKESGRGLKTLNFVVDDIARTTQQIRIVIVDYPTGSLTKTVVIPVVDPQVAIVALDQKDNPKIYQAKPYFFNTLAAKLLNFRWTINGIVAEGPETDPNFLSLTVNGGGPGSIINIDVAVSNPIKQLESATTKKTIVME